MPVKVLVLLYSIKDVDRGQKREKKINANCEGITSTL